MSLADFHKQVNEAAHKSVTKRLTDKRRLPGATAAVRALVPASAAAKVNRNQQFALDLDRDFPITSHVARDGTQVCLGQDTVEISVSGAWANGVEPVLRAASLPTPPPPPRQRYRQRHRLPLLNSDPISPVRSDHSSHDGHDGNDGNGSDDDWGQL